MKQFQILVTTISSGMDAKAMTTVVIPFDVRDEAIIAANIINENKNWDTRQASFSQVAIMLFE